MRVVAGLRDHDLGVACPADGPLAVAVESAGIERLPLPAVDASLRLHPVQTPVGLAQLGAGGRCSRSGRAPLSAGGHSRQHAARRADGRARAAPRRPAGRRARPRAPSAFARSGARCAPCSSAQRARSRPYSDYTARRFNEGLAAPVATRVYNSIDHARFDPDAGPPGRAARAARPRPGRRSCSARSLRSRPGRARTPRSGRWPSCAAGASTPICVLVGADRLSRQGGALRQPRLPAPLQRLVDDLGGRRCGPLPGSARRRAGDPERARPLAAALVGGAVRAGDGGEHGDGHSAARDARRRRARAGAGRRHRPGAAAGAAGHLGGGRARAAGRSRAPRASGPGRPGRGRALPRRGPRSRDARHLRSVRRREPRLPRSPRRAGWRSAHPRTGWRHHGRADLAPAGGGGPRTPWVPGISGGPWAWAAPRPSPSAGADPLDPGRVRARARPRRHRALPARPALGNRRAVRVLVPRPPDPPLAGAQDRLHRATTPCRSRRSSPPRRWPDSS